MRYGTKSLWLFLVYVSLIIVGVFLHEIFISAWFFSHCNVNFGAIRGHFRGLGLSSVARQKLVSICSEPSFGWADFFFLLSAPSLLPYHPWPPPSLFSLPALSSPHFPLFLLSLPLSCLPLSLLFLLPHCLFLTQSLFYIHFS